MCLGSPQRRVFIRLLNVLLILILTLGIRPSCLVSDLDIVAGGELLGASAIDVVGFVEILFFKHIIA